MILNLGTLIKYDQYFKEEPRNVRISLEDDAINPFGEIMFI